MQPYRTYVNYVELRMYVIGAHLSLISSADPDTPRSYTFCYGYLCCNILDLDLYISEDYFFLASICLVFFFFFTREYRKLFRLKDIGTRYSVKHITHIPLVYEKNTKHRIHVYGATRTVCIV